ncbi:MAG: hypothetical protein WCI55_13975 [Armatimonadota bacterium]
MNELIEPGELKLPVLHMEEYPRVVEEQAMLLKVQYASTTDPILPNYYLDSNGDWFIGVYSKVSARVNPILRMLGYSDVVKVDMKFEKLSEPPVSAKKLDRYFLDAADVVSYQKGTGYSWGSKEYTKLVRAEYKTCVTSADKIQWLIKYKLRMTVWGKY